MKIKEVRKAVGWTQAKLSKELGIPTATIEAWDRGTRVPPSWVEKLVVEEIKRKSEKES